MVGPHLDIMHCPSISNNPEWSFCLNELWKLVLPTGKDKWISSSLHSGHTRQPELQNMESLSPLVIMLYQNRTYYLNVLCKIQDFWETIPLLRNINHIYTKFQLNQFGSFCVSMVQTRTQTDGYISSELVLITIFCIYNQKHYQIIFEPSLLCNK